MNKCENINIHLIFFYIERIKGTGVIMEIVTIMHENSLYA